MYGDDGYDTIELDTRDTSEPAGHLPDGGYDCTHDRVRVRLLPHPAPGGGVIIEVTCPGQQVARRHVRAGWPLTL